MADPRVSVVIPCFRAESTIAETVAGVVGQTFADWEVILASDDGQDYVSFLRDRGITDRRIRGVAESGDIATGHTATRERGLAVARGAVIADLDGDDVWRADRLARLVPLAEAHGAAFDVVTFFTGLRVLGTSAAPDGRMELLGPAAVVAGDFPIHLVARRDCCTWPWTAFPQATPDPIRTAVIAAATPVVRLRLPLLRYRVHAASFTQSAPGSERAEASYADIIGRLEGGDRYGLDDAVCNAVLAGFRRKRALNRRHLAALSEDPSVPGFLTWLLEDRRKAR